MPICSGGATGAGLLAAAASLAMLAGAGMLGSAEVWTAGGGAAGLSWATISCAVTTGATGI